MTSTNSVSLVIGANSRIARELINQTLATKAAGLVIAISRSVDPELVNANDGRLLWLQTDYSEESIAKITARLLSYKGRLEQVFICNGILHNDSVFPEKRLEELDPLVMEEVMRINAFIPALWLKHLKPLLKGKQECVVTVFSARIGSIEDNSRGGWYAYRASKAALNMLLKTAAIEYRRIAKHVRFLSFHPGTTDTPLSEPFQKSVARDKLFTPSFVVERLFSVLEQMDKEEPIQYLAWDGQAIAW